MRRGPRLLILGAAGALLLSAGRPARADDFANARLAAGAEAHRAGRFAEASDELRIACFGLLDQPVLLTEALVRLSLAQEAAGRSKDAAGTLGRFVEVQRRFGSYANARLEPDVRRAFETLLRARLNLEVRVAPAAPPAPSPASGGVRKDP